ncbi:Protein kinase [Sorangium cellulosum So ce56]|uniref:Protein kinase n=1 Tax=Sorangium cellulosum (strain So ce56) TaxID=448385 RepID=A9G3U5_SORC5|nr:serine/threonine-protein kinase [Sorangium cellulosum]CAN95799.1 Protein kinase [Sorangium cellulosum So ce56]
MTRVPPEGFRPEALVGQVLRGKWRLERLLGFGGMAMVYAATHRNGMRGAVKILRRELSEDEEARSRFLREGYVANRVEHPGIVRVLDDDVTDDGSVFLVMELLEGETVEARRAREPGGVLGVNEVLGIAEDLLDVLAVAHERGIVHRDLKPDNLFLTRHGQLKVLDFGIARLRELSSPANASTRAGTLMGTPQFMPPEQARGQWDRVDPRSDLWAVGSTMYQLLSGRYVHQAETLPLLLLAAMTQPAPPVGSVLPALPPPIAGVMDVALAFDPDRRWPNARAMQRALRQARGGAALELAPGAPPDAGRAPLHSEHGHGLLHSDPGRPSAQARGPGSGPRGTEFAAAGTASGVAAGGGAASTGTVSPVVERSASAERSAPRAAAAGALLAGALAVGALVALVWWQRGGERGAEDPSHGSTVEAEPRLTAGAGATTAPPDSAGSPGAGVQPAPSGDAVPAIAPSAPATTPAPEAAIATAASASAHAAPASASASAAAPRPAAGGRARSPATPTKAPAAPAPAPAPTPAEDPYNRRR